MAWLVSYALGLFGVDDLDQRRYRAYVVVDEGEQALPVASYRYG